MGVREISNVSGALDGPVTDYRTGMNSSGFALSGEQEVELYRADAAVTEGQAVAVVAPTATNPISVTPLTTAIAAKPLRHWGVALQSAAAGNLVRVMRRGVAVIQHDTSDTPAAYDFVLLPDATTGRYATAATSAVGTVPLGIVLGPEVGTSDRCLAYIGPGAIPTTA